MRSKEAKLALRLIAAMLTDPKLKPDDGDQLRDAQRDLIVLARTGKMERRKLFRIVRILCQVHLRLL